MPRAPVAEASSDDALSEKRHQLHWDGWTRLEGGMPDWELRSFVERLHRRYCGRIIRMLEQWRSDWMKGDDENSAPGAGRPGALVAKRANRKLKGTGIFLYAAHPSQDDAAEGAHEYSGPRFYITCSEAVMKRYASRGVAPPPPQELQDVLWPRPEDRRRPWLTEMGWTLVPEDSHPQVMHADICSCSQEDARKAGQGRYHHFAWKLSPEDQCTTNVVSGGFSEGCATWDDYDKWSMVKANTVIFDSEMLHRGGQTRAGVGWTTTLTLQVCSGSGWGALQDRVSAGLMWYTQALGWEVGAAVDAFANGSWQPALVASRTGAGAYNVVLEQGGALCEGLQDSELRYRQAAPKLGDLAGESSSSFRQSDLVDALFQGEWHAAKVACANADGTYRVTWLADRTFTDGLPASALRARARCAASDFTSASSDTRSLASPSPSAASTRSRSTRRRSPSATASTSAGSAEGGGGEADAPCSKRRRKEPSPAALPPRSDLVARGFVELAGGLPDHWDWKVFDFVEDCFDRFGDLVASELEALRGLWRPCEGTGQRHGAFAAAKATERLKEFGLAVYSPGNSQAEKAPYACTGPRWYVSVTPRALEHFGAAGAPAPPAELWELLCGHPADSAEQLRARGLGWTLAPAGSDPQSLHADLYGTGPHRRTGDRTRWPHVLWKRKRTDFCTTEIVPEAFTEGAFGEHHFGLIRRVRAPAILVDSEALHRGAATPAPPQGGGPGPEAAAPQGWVSSLSLELCTASGWAAWEAFETGGTTKDPSSSMDWRMLVINRPPAPSAAGPAKAPSGRGQGRAATKSAELPPAPWHEPKGMAKLRREQRQWELSC